MNKKMVKNQLSFNTQCFNKYFQKIGELDSSEQQKQLLISGLVSCAIATNQVDAMLKYFYDPRI